jgi:hypothetical protein
MLNDIFRFNRTIAAFEEVIDHLPIVFFGFEGARSLCALLHGLI